MLGKKKCVAAQMQCWNHSDTGAAAPANLVFCIVSYSLQQQQY
jgi:hypothetical protein